jgi:glycosyltransferase involved in cell wall biosynthesis
MKPRIFINMHYLEIGGAETSLIGMLNALSPEKVEVDLFLNDHRGEMMPFIPEWVHLLPEIKPYKMLERPMWEALKAGCFRLVFHRLRARFAYRKYLKATSSTRQGKEEGSATHYIADYVIGCLPDLKYLGKYDLAISYIDPPHVVQEKVDALKRIEWVHTDFSTVDLDYKVVHPRWAKNDFIASVSSDVTKQFLKRFPDLAGKVIEIENMLSPAFVRMRAEEFLPDDMPINRGLTLLTIGRFSYQKRLEGIPLICKMLVDKGLDIKWSIIGYGGSDAYIRSEINRCGMQEHVFLLGKKSNPYPYIKHCDVYVQPSRFEGKSVAVREAQMLSKPVIITNYPTASSQVVSGKDGFIVPMSMEQCAEEMFWILTDSKTLDAVARYCGMHDYGNESEIAKLYDLAL